MSSNRKKRAKRKARRQAVSTVTGPSQQRVVVTRPTPKTDPVNVTGGYVRKSLAIHLATQDVSYRQNSYRAVAQAKRPSIKAASAAGKNADADRLSRRPKAMSRSRDLVPQNVPNNINRATVPNCSKRPDSKIAGKISALRAKSGSGSRAKTREERLRGFRLWCK